MSTLALPSREQAGLPDEVQPDVEPALAKVMSTEEIRARFPALDREEGGERVAYFDGPGGTQTPQRVVDVVADYLLHHNANTHWRYPTSAETDAILQSSRETLACFLGADADEISFGANMTTLAFHVSRGLSREWSAGDELVVTELDHHANVAPWKALEVERGVHVRTVKMDARTGELDADGVARCITERTRLIAIGGASNALGTVNDLPAIIGMAKQAGALTFVDAVHLAPHELIDVIALDCDMLACSAYKFYGPHVGVLYTRRDLLERVDVPRLEPAPQAGPERVETGTQNHEGIAGAAAAVEFIASLTDGATVRERLTASVAALHERSAALLTRMWEALSLVPGVTLYGPPPDRPRTATVAFTIDGVRSSEVARALARRGVFVSHGDFYAATVVERLGLGEEGLVRAGCACYTTAEEVDRMIDGVRSIAHR